jgi:hypothetical protein
VPKKRAATPSSFAPKFHKNTRFGLADGLYLGILRNRMTSAHRLVVFQNLFDLADVEYSDFVRTTDSRHQEAAVALWVSRLRLSNGVHTRGVKTAIRVHV